MVRCYKALSNPPPSCYNLRKVKIHVRRLRSGNGGSSSCAGDQHPQLESPGPAGSAGGTPSRRTRFRYCSVFSALQEWWLKREGGWEGFWAEGAGAICEAFVWPNYYKAPYTLYWQRRACCSLTRGMGKLSFLSLLLSVTRMEKWVEGPLWNQAKAVRSPRAPTRCSSAGIGPGATAVKGGRAAGGGERDPTRLLARQPCWLVGMGGRMWNVPSYSHVSPASCWESCINSAKTALLLRVLFPCCIKMHRSFSYLLVLQGKEVVFTAEKTSLSQKHHLASQNGDNYTWLPDILILIQVLKRTSRQENFLLNSQLLSILERHMQYFVVPLSCHRLPWESELLGAARLCRFSLCAHIAVSCWQNSPSQEFSQSFQ